MIPLSNFVTYLNDIIDIVLVAVVIYNLILLVRGTRALQLLKGIMVIVAAWLLSMYFNLDTLQWMMSQAFSLGVFAILIIFQPELRRGLEQLGSGRLFIRVPQTDEEDQSQSIADIVKASLYLAKRRIGGLIVLERKMNLNEFVETGTRINGKISSELLINIFIPNTPLHDGAVIVKDHQILAAACYLPLSESTEISKELGTRHRAAIGMSEVSDAIVVIISEETGQVSVAMHGNIIRDVKEEGLSKFLTNNLQADREPRTFWQRRGSNDG